MRSHRRRQPIEHVLIAGAIEDLASIRSVLGLLPSTAYGQVLLELPAWQPVPELSAPPRVTVHRVDRDAENDTDEDPGVRADGHCTPLCAAFGAWRAEWMPEEVDPEREVTIWVGSHASGRADGQMTVMGNLVEEL